MNRQAFEGHLVERWTDWFGAEPRLPFDYLVSRGGPAHKERLLIWIFEHRRAVPSVFAKAGLGEREARFVAREAAALDELQPHLSPAVAPHIPRHLGVVCAEGAAVLVQEAVPGRRLRVPGTGSGVNWRAADLRSYRRFVHEAVHLSARLWAATPVSAREEALTPEVLCGWVEEFRQLTSQQFNMDAACTRLSNHLGTVSIAARRGWQHGDLTLENTIKNRGRYVFLDWEHASRDREPWFDAASLPLALISQPRRRTALDLRQAACLTLSGEHAAGRIVVQALRSTWAQPIPISAALILLAMRQALLRAMDGRAWQPAARVAALLLTDAGVQRVLHRIDAKDC